MKTFKNRKANNLNRRRIVIDLESIERNKDGLITAFEAEIIRDDDVLVEGTKLEANEFSQVLGSVVSAYHGTAEEKGEFELESLVLPEVIEPNYELETKGMLGSDITWVVNSNNIGITIQNNKVIYNKTFTERVFTLKACIDCESEVLEKEFEVKTEILTHKEAVDNDHEELILPTKIIRNLELPLMGEYGSTIEWVVSTLPLYSNYVKLLGGTLLNVTRANENYTINLTALIKNEDYTRIKEFEIIVEKMTSVLSIYPPQIQWTQNKTKLNSSTHSITFNNLDNLKVVAQNNYDDIDVLITQGKNVILTFVETQTLNNKTTPFNSSYDYKFKVYLEEGNYYIGEIHFTVKYTISSTSPED